MVIVHAELTRRYDYARRRNADPEITGERQIRSAAVDRPIQTTDGRNATALEPVDELLELVEVLRTLSRIDASLCSGQGAQIVAGAKRRASACEHENVHRIVFLDVDEDLSKYFDVGRLDAIVVLRPIQTDHGTPL